MQAESLLLCSQEPATYANPKPDQSNLRPHPIYWISILILSSLNQISLLLFYFLWHCSPRGFLITHNDAPQSVGLLWTSDQLVAETSTWQHTQQTNIHAPGGIRTNDRSMRAAVDLRLKPRGHWDRQPNVIRSLN
jgi:hypothetical protein